MATPQSSEELIRPLAAFNGVKPPAPEWFEKAVAAPSEECETTVRGAKIRYSVWGEGNRRGLLFIHGGRAHRNWWRPFAPFFAEDRRVAALDLSGMGDSDWREQYSMDCLIDEVFTVLAESGLERHGRPIIIGHSFGGWVTLAAVEREGERLGGAIVIDSPLGVPDPNEGYTIRLGNEGEENKAAKGLRLYSDIAEPIKRFRFLPNQPGPNPYLVDYIAREGLVHIDGPDGSGWRWKFDPQPGKKFEIHFEANILRAARCPMAFIYGEKSLFAEGDSLNHLITQAQGRSPFILMPEAYHHLMMDHPVGFVTAMRTLLSCWPVRVGI